MTRNTITIELTCNGKTLRMGPNEDIDITKVTGLESSELELSTSDNALVDGASVDGKKIKPRPIHIEASFKSNKNNRKPTPWKLNNSLINDNLVREEKKEKN